MKDRQKNFAYAASFGVSSWPVGYPSAGKMLEDFRAISTREKTGAGIVRAVTEKMPPLSVSVAPVFLLGRAIWQHFVKPATGMFAALSDVVLEMGSVVYGAGYDEEWNVMHKRAETKEARDEMRGSKYVQSDMRDTFRRVLEDLSKGRTVLFSGTHCQCAGLRSLAEMRHARTEKLFLVDIVCHGVPSPKIYQVYMEFMKKHKGEIERFNFRNKGKFGWHSHVESAIIKGKEYDTELYVDLFYGHKTVMPSVSVQAYGSRHGYHRI